MRLTDLDNTNTPVKALKENFGMEFDVSGLDRAKTRAMLLKVKGLLGESKKSPNAHHAQTDPTYMKLVFMEQALTQHMKVAKSPRIVVENEEVEKSQVILAAQDMVDTIQKMYEDVNDMLVKELPALVDSIQSEIGVNESDQFNQSVNETLSNLNSTLQEARTALQSALGGLTGQGGPDAFGGDPLGGMGGDLGADPLAGDDMGMGGDDLGMPADDGADLDLPPVPDMDEPESPEAPAGNVGRPKR